MQLKQNSNLNWLYQQTIVLSCKTTFLPGRIDQITYPKNLLEKVVVCIQFAVS